ncbi:MAG: DUF4266 domain-containing protein [Verrucomicrobia bacterium]|nr:MAG: DUF4266 domain-containing protein [Verrucomicrobiota bacterium]
MKPRSSIRYCRAVIAVAAMAVMSGCSAVRPWERDHLAQYGMRPDRDRLGSAMGEHLWFSREAVHGGRAVGGGGCGCN